MDNTNTLHRCTKGQSLMDDWNAAVQRKAPDDMQHACKEYYKHKHACEGCRMAAGAELTEIDAA